jgi:hypothetical protein
MAEREEETEGDIKKMKYQEVNGWSEDNELGQQEPEEDVEEDLEDGIQGSLFYSSFEL